MRCVSCQQHSRRSHGFDATIMDLELVRLLYLVFIRFRVARQHGFEMPISRLRYSSALVR